jgi:hypothetical protein
VRRCLLRRNSGCRVEKRINATKIEEWATVPAPAAVVPTTGEEFHPFSRNCFLRDVAWIHHPYLWTRSGDAGAASPTVPVRRKRRPKQSKHRFASLQHHPLIIAPSLERRFLLSSKIRRRK